MTKLDRRLADAGVALSSAPLLFLVYQAIASLFQTPYERLLAAAWCGYAHTRHADLHCAACWTIAAAVLAFGMAVAYAPGINARNPVMIRTR